MSTYTKYPWIWEDANGRFNSDHGWSASDEFASVSESAPIWAGGKVIALVVHSSEELTIESNPELIANARLIAAAPDLLEFAQLWISRQGDDTNYMTEMARAAISKATGQKGGA